LPSTISRSAAVAASPVGVFHSGAAIPSDRIAMLPISRVSPSRMWVTAPVNGRAVGIDRRCQQGEQGEQEPRTCPAMDHRSSETCCCSGPVSRSAATVTCCAGSSKSVADDARQQVANRIVEHLELSGFGIDEAQQVMERASAPRHGLCATAHGAWGKLIRQQIDARSGGRDGTDAGAAVLYGLASSMLDATIPSSEPL
jgi:hypothetical protein